MSETKRYSLRRKTLNVELEAEDGNVQPLLMKELTGAQREEYISFMSSKMKMENGKPAGLRDMKGMHVELLRRSLYTPDGQPVDPAVIASWPGSVQGDLFSDAQKLSGLDNKAEEAAKNDSPGSGESGSESPAP